MDNKVNRQRGFTLYEVMVVTGALGFIGFCGFLISKCTLFSF